MRRRALLAAFVAAGTVAALSGCTLASAITPPVESALYPTTSDVGGSNGSIPIPSWVPSDAQMVHIKQNTETGDAIMQFGMAAAVAIGTPCDASVSGNLPPLDDTWWPQSLPTDTATCQDGWHIVFLYGSQYFAWKP